MIYTCCFLFIYKLDTFFIFDIDYFLGKLFETLCRLIFLVA